MKSCIFCVYEQSMTFGKEMIGVLSSTTNTLFVIYMTVSYSCEISGNLTLFKELHPVLNLACKSLAFSGTREIIHVVW